MKKNEIKLEFEVKCSECGEKLNAVFNGGLTFSVGPCVKCMGDAYDKGVREGENA